jgi:glycosyltransferase involved in cell wall biosynthesis
MRGVWEKMVIDLDLSQNIVFTGHIPEEDKKEFLRGCAALVLPSFAEGLALTPLEAFAMKKPVLLADIPSSHEIVDDGVDGFIIGAKDVDKWSEKIILVLSNKIASENMGMNGRMKVERKFNLVRVLNDIELLYSRLKKE